MKKFVFTLQKLYEVKEKEEDAKRLELAALDKKLSELMDALQDSIDKFNGQKAQYAVKCRKGISTFDLKNYGDYFQFLMKEMKNIRELIARCEVEINLCRGELLKLINERKVLDRMRDEQKIEYNAEMNKFNEKEVEDFMQGRL